VDVTTYSPRGLCFPELNTHDVELAKRFYGPLLGWDFFDGLELP
jgi:hypothetical protein